MEEGHHKHKGIIFLVAGAVLILARLFTTWDIWVVIGALMILKAIMILLMPTCCPMKAAQKKKR